MRCAFHKMSTQDTTFLVDIRYPYIYMYMYIYFVILFLKNDIRLKSYESPLSKMVLFFETIYKNK